MSSCKWRFLWDSWGNAGLQRVREMRSACRSHILTYNTCFVASLVFLFKTCPHKGSVFPCRPSSQKVLIVVWNFWLWWETSADSGVRRSFPSHAPWTFLSALATTQPSICCRIRRLAGRKSTPAHVKSPLLLPAQKLPVCTVLPLTFRCWSLL